MERGKEEKVGTTRTSGRDIFFLQNRIVLRDSTLHADMLRANTPPLDAPVLRATMLHCVTTRGHRSVCRAIMVHASMTHVSMLRANMLHASTRHVNMDAPPNAASTFSRTFTERSVQRIH